MQDQGPAVAATERHFPSEDLMEAVNLKKLAGILSFGPCNVNRNGVLQSSPQD